MIMILVLVLVWINPHLLDVILQYHTLLPYIYCMFYLCVDLYTHILCFYQLSSSRPTKRRCSGIRCPVQIGKEKREKNYAKCKLIQMVIQMGTDVREKRMGKNPFFVL